MHFTFWQRLAPSVDVIDRTRVYIFSFITIMLIASCGGTDTLVGNSVPSIDSDSSFLENEPQVQSYKTSGFTTDRSAMNSVFGMSVGQDRMTVTNANMDILVPQVSEAMSQIALHTTASGGIVISSQLTGEEEDEIGWMSLRIPAEHLSASILTIRNLAVRVTRESTFTQDVTEEYLDLDSRLRILKETAEQYSHLLDRAETVEDILKVRSAATEVAVQIEQLVGRMEYLESTSANSLIVVEIRPATNPKSLVEPGWNPSETARSAIRGLNSFGQNLINVVIHVVIFSPAWIPITVVLWFAGRWMNHRRDQNLR